MELMALIELLQTVGVPLGLLAFFLWWQYKKEEKMGARIEKREDLMTNRIAHLENGQRETLFQLQRESITALSDVSHALIRFTELVDKMPCVHKDDEK